MSGIEDGHSMEEIPDPFPNSEVKLHTPAAVVSHKRRNTGAVLVVFLALSVDYVCDKGFDNFVCDNSVCFIVPLVNSRT